MRKQTFTLTVLTLFISGNFALSATDTPETRRHEAERYLQATPPKALFEDMAEKMAANLPPDQRDQFKKLMTSELDSAALTKAMIDSMVKHFTTEEFKALADFYGSPVGKSAMQKFGAYMADIMPTLEAEIIKAQAKRANKFQISRRAKTDIVCRRSVGEADCFPRIGTLTARPTASAGETPAGRLGMD